MLNNRSGSHPFSELASGKKFIYAATRLYDYSEKLATLKLEEAILAGLSDASDYLNIPLQIFPTFMPFRDTVENNKTISQNVKREERARSIFIEDIKRLQHLFALVTYLNDPCKDDGICMEIGFAFAKQVPILLIVTDFIHYSSISNPEIEFPLDPVLVRMCNTILHYKSLSSSRVPFPKDRNFNAMKRVVVDFEQRLYEANKQLYGLVRDHMREIATNPRNFVNELPVGIIGRKESQKKKTVFIDFAGGAYEWCRAYAQNLAASLINKGFIVRIGNRHNPDHHTKLLDTEKTQKVPYNLGDIDLQAALTSDILVLSADAVETDSGTAAIQGAAYALNKKIILYYSGNVQTNARDRTPTARNLMILYSANQIVSSLDEIPGIVEETIRTGNSHE